VHGSAVAATPFLWAAVLGVGFSPISVLVFTLLPETIKPHQVGMGLGVLTCASNLGIAVGPSAFGLFLDLTNSNFKLGFILLAAVSVVMIMLVAGLKNRDQATLKTPGG